MVVGGLQRNPSFVGNRLVGRQSFFPGRTAGGPAKQYGSVQIYRAELFYTEMGRERLSNLGRLHPLRTVAGFQADRSRRTEWDL